VGTKERAGDVVGMKERGGWVNAGQAHTTATSGLWVDDENAFSKWTKPQERGPSGRESWSVALGMERKMGCRGACFDSFMIADVSVLIDVAHFSTPCC